MAESDLQPSIAMPRLAVIQNDERTGWRTEWKAVQVSGFRLPEIERLIGDDSVAMRTIGLRAELEPLARLLDETSDLATRPHPFVMGQGADRILSSFVVPLTYQYLNELRNVEIAEERLLDRLAAELVEVAGGGQTRSVHQVVVSGLYVDEQLESHNVRVRSLSEFERGSIAEQATAFARRPARFRDEYVPFPQPATVPETLIEVRETHAVAMRGEPSSLVPRLLLALYLEGLEYGSTGQFHYFDVPQWAMIGQMSSPLPVGVVRVERPSRLNQESLERAVALALRMAPFGSSESGREEIILHRLLRACGSESPEAFLDFAIALEAALLKGDKNELAYRFKLYGALFLSDVMPANEAFEKLARIYKIRSNLVHGVGVSADQLREARTDARHLALAVVRKSISSGWPDRTALDLKALDTSFLSGGAGPER